MSNAASRIKFASSLESVISTKALKTRPSRPRDYETENRALLAIAQHIADSPRTALQKLAETALEICRAGSAGVSLLSKNSSIFYWPTIAGAWKPYAGHSVQHDSEPSAVVLEHNATQLFSRPARYFTDLARFEPTIEEALVSPFYVDETAVGTVWVLAHDAARKFDAEDGHLVESLSRLAAAVYPFRMAWLEHQEQQEQSQSLRDVNAKLVLSSIRQQELTEQAQNAEAAVRETEKRAVSELEATQRLQETSTRLIREDNVAVLYEQILDAAAAIMRSEYASIHLLHPERGNGGELQLLGYRGFTPEAAPRWEWVGSVSDSTSCGMALRSGQRIIVPDVEECEFMAGSDALAAYLQTGIHAMQSTPLVSRAGRLLGMISTHWRKPHHPAEHGLHLLDVLARQAADFIERLQVEEALRRSEERFRSLVAIITDVPWTADAEGQFIAPQPAWAAYTGQTWEQMRGFGWADALHPEDRATIQNSWDRACAARGLYHSRGRVWHSATQQYRRFEVRATPLLQQDGAVREWVGTYTDVEERARSEEQLRQTQKLESVGLLAAGVAHDFNNLLVGVMGNASLASDMLPRSHPASELLKDVLTTSEHAALLTKQMLAYAGKGRFVLELVNLSELIKDITAIIEPSISKKIAVRLVLEPNLNAVEADRGQMQQTVTNLVLNAAEAIGDTVGLITITTGIQQLDAAYTRQHFTDDPGPGNYVYLQVQDTGCGMDEETQSKIFDPFFTTKFTGRGLGLAAVAGIVRGHKGALTVTSEVGKGSVFTVFLPAHKQYVTRTQQAAGDVYGTETILIVDDEVVVREAAKRSLEHYGYTVLQADSGAAAIEIFRSEWENIAMVLLDLSMPGLNGQETLVELRRINSGAEVLISSGYNETETMRLFAGSHVAGFIQKPYTSQQLAKKIRAIMG